MPYAVVNGVTLNYEQGGDGPPVVYIHGGFASLSMALQELTAEEVPRWTWEWDFARHFSFLWYDRRGCYRSERTTAGYALENQARDLAGMLDHRGMESAHVIGSSAGGPISLVFAALWPERTRSLVLTGTGLDLFPRGDPPSDIIREQIALLERDGAESAFEQRPAGVEATFETLWGREEAEARGDLAGYLQEEQALAQQAQAVPHAERVAWYAVELRNMQAYMERDLSNLAAQVTCPTLVLHGSNDRTAYLTWGERLAQAIPTARLHVVAGGGHGLVHRTEAGRRIAIEYITEQEARRQTSA